MKNTRTWFESVSSDSPHFQGTKVGFPGRNAEVHVVSADDTGEETRLRLVGTDQRNIAGPVAEALGRGCLDSDFDPQTAGFKSNSPEGKLLRRCLGVSRAIMEYTTEANPNPEITATDDTVVDLRSHTGRAGSRASKTHTNSRAPLLADLRVPPEAGFPTNSQVTVNPSGVAMIRTEVSSAQSRG